MTPTFSCIITCKGRLEHLRESLPRVQSAGFEEIIVVDFDCPQSTAGWCSANYPKVKTIRVVNQPTFNPSKARNIGGQNASSKWLCFLDADVIIKKHFIESFRGKMRHGSFYPFSVFLRGHQNEALHGVGGSVVCEHSAFSSVGGYDEFMADCGWEDLDFYQRLVRSGHRARLSPPDTIEYVIQHGGRIGQHLSLLRNGFYCAAKFKLIDMFGFNAVLPLSVRAELFAQATAGAQKWNSSDLNSVSSMSFKLPTELNNVHARITKQQIKISIEEVNRMYRFRKAWADRLVDNRYIDKLAIFVKNLPGFRYLPS